MPDININGVPPGTPPTQPGTYRGSVSDNPQRAADFEAARKSTQRPESQQTASDYDRALKQQAREISQSAQAESRQRRQEEALFRSREQHQQRQQRAQDRQLREETRMRDAQLREEARARKLIERRRDQDERAQAMLERRKATEAERRQRQETMLGRAFSNLESRASAVQSPATYRAIQRASGNLQSRIGDFQRRYGGATPFGVGSIPGLLGGMGSFENTYATQNINRLGNLGARAADNRSYTELVRIEHELHRIQRVNEKQLNATSGASKEQKINAQRNLEAVREAKSRIGVARGGSSKFTNMAGNVIGTGGMLFNDPALRTAMDIAIATAGAPFAIGKAVSGLVGMQQPYLNFRIGGSQLARAGGFNMNDLQSRILPSGFLNSAVPGLGQSDQMRALGLGPSDVLRNLNSYGVAPRSASEAVNIASTIRSAYIAPGIGLNENVLGGLLGQARNSGAVQGGTEAAFNMSAQRYFSELQKVTATATSLGVDRSRFANIFTQTMATGIGVPNPATASNFIGRMLNSGSPEMRSGQGVVGLMGDINKSMANLGPGGGPVQNIGLMSFFQNQGGMPTSEAGLKKALGVSDSTWNAMVGTPVAQGALHGYLAAVNSGDKAGAAQYVGQLIQGQPQIAERIFQGSIYGRAFGANADLGPRARSGFLGTSLSRSLAFSSTLPGQGATANVGGTMMAPVLSPSIYQAALQASQKTGVPMPTLLALAGAESRGDSGATSSAGAIGAFQVMPATAAQYGYTAEDMRDPVKAAIVAAKEFKKNQAMARAHGVPEGQIDQVAMGSYNWGRGHTDQIAAGNMPNETRGDITRFTNYQAQYSNGAIPELQTQATGDVANIKAAEYITNASDVVVKAFDWVATAANRAAAALSSINHAPMAPTTGQALISNAPARP